MQKRTKIESSRNSALDVRCNQVSKKYEKLMNLCVHFAVLFDDDEGERTRITMCNEI